MSGDRQPRVMLAMEADVPELICLLVRFAAECNMPVDPAKVGQAALEAVRQPYRTYLLITPKRHGKEEAAAAMTFKQSKDGPDMHLQRIIFLKKYHQEELLQFMHSEVEKGLAAEGAKNIIAVVSRQVESFVSLGYTIASAKMIKHLRSGE